MTIGIDQGSAESLTCPYVLSFQQGGVSEEEIGVITPYRQQVALMSETLKKKGLCKVEVNTVDQYQGRDKDVILISFVKRKDGQGPVSMKPTWYSLWNEPVGPVIKFHHTVNFFPCPLMLNMEAKHTLLSAKYCVDIPYLFVANGYK